MEVDVMSKYQSWRISWLSIIQNKYSLRLFRILMWYLEVHEKEEQITQVVSRNWTVIICMESHKNVAKANSNLYAIAYGSKIWSSFKGCILQLVPWWRLHDNYKPQVNLVFSASLVGTSPHQNFQPINTPYLQVYSIDIQPHIITHYKAPEARMKTYAAFNYHLSISRVKIEHAFEVHTQGEIPYITITIGESQCWEHKQVTL